MQVVRVYEQPITAAEIGPPPLTLAVISNPNRIETEHGAVSTKQKMNTYVLYDVLPDDLKRRVKLAIESLQAQI
jgi:hypothetical protein